MKASNPMHPNLRILLIPRPEGIQAQPRGESKEQGLEKPRLAQLAAAAEATAKVSLGETTQEEASESPFLDEILHARSGPTDQTSEPISPGRGIASVGRR
jgi:hypothetical protein